ncbi:DNA photolyase [Erythrobacter sp. R86502]|uniref:DNA photolyase n=1 Tax=Erythrobacter sp. R86502 TaxID=3093846 RepID=UPI0036D2DD80
MNQMPTDFLNAELSARATPLNKHSVRQEADYILVWLQQTFRGDDHPAIDAGVQIANALGLPALVYHGLREDYPHASDRLHGFIIGASREMARTLERRGIACVQHVVRPGHETKGLVYRLADRAACVVTDAHATFVANFQATRFADKLDRAVIAVDATRLVPHALLPSGLGATKVFRAAHKPLREQCLADRQQIEPEIKPYKGELPFKPDHLANLSDAGVKSLIADCRIDHTLPISDEYPANKASVAKRVELLTSSIIMRYKWTRNNPADAGAGSQLSAYLHFGMTSPFAVLRALNQAEVPAALRWKFLDELLTWREWCHWRMTEKPGMTQYSSLPSAARKTMEAHAGDPREVLPLEALIHGNTPDETWNAAQRQWLATGWMHNNLRMYWAKQIIKWTRTPGLAWATGCYLNDRLSIDGRDPATYVMMRWAFGEARPGYSELPIFGWISPKGDSALRKRAGVPQWLSAMASAEVPQIKVPQSEDWARMYTDGTS